MDTSRITSGLRRAFEERRIVFWHDPAREFDDTVSSLDLNDVTVLRLDENAAFETKVRLERDDPDHRFLIYAPFEEPDPEEDWLLDIRLYSRSFRADRASLVLDALGLGDTKQRLRPHLAKRAKFLASKDRLEKLKRLVEATDEETELDRKMLAVTVRAEQETVFGIVQTLFDGMAEGFASLDEPPAVWADIERFDLAEPFWRLVEGSFGYTEDSPKLATLLIRLLVTDFAQALNGPLPEALRHLVLPPRAVSNAVVCVSQWRDSYARSASYDRLSERVADAIKLSGILEPFDVEPLLGVMTFREVERHVIRALRDRVASGFETIDVEEVRSIASRRKDGYWCSGKLASTEHAPREAFSACYEALIAAAELFDLRQRKRDGFSYPTAKAFYDAYVGELYRFDQLYRLFCEAAENARAMNWDVIKPLRQMVEDFYGTGFVDKLALSWGKHLDPSTEAGLLRRWTLEGVPQQHRFFRRHVQPELERSPNRKVFVIISDAFRFEAAEELTRDLNGKFRFKAELSSQLGVLPSYTSLGMAALLPHGELSFGATGDVQVDGKPTMSTEQRAKILQTLEGTALRATDLLSMNKEQGRDVVRLWRVVYVYHNRIDARGDDRQTESDAFRATRETIDELGKLVSRIINNLNGSYVVVTADHGFLFQETPPDPTDRSVITEKPSAAVKWKKRYVLGRSLPDHDSVWHGRTAVTAGAADDMEFWVPKGANRFHFTGGARFIHGGAMPQEIVVPVVTVRELEGKRAEATQVRQVPVHVLGGPHKITTNRHRFKLLQMEAVGDRVRPLAVQVAVYEGDDPVTNVAPVTFDSQSNDIDERTKSVFLTLEGRKYDKKTPYTLILRNSDTGVEEQRVDVTIDKTFFDDF